MSGWLRVESNGTVEVDEAAGLQLARRPGRFQLAGTAPELLLAIRQPGAQRPPIGRVAFCGDFDGLPFPDVAMILAQGRRSGLLHVTGGNAERVLVFSGGDVVGASSTQAGERLGEVALRLGLLERTDLATLLSSPAAGGRVGQRLVERGLVDGEGLARAVREQVVLVFEAILHRPAGAFWFCDRPVAPEEGTEPLQVQALLLDGLRRIDEWSHYRTRIATPQTEVRLGEAVLPVEDAAAAQIVELLRRGPSTPAQIADSLRLPEIDVVRVLFHLAEAGAVVAQADRAARPLAELGADPAPLRELIHAFNGLFAEVFTEIALSSPGAEGFSGAADAVLRAQGPFFAGLSFGGCGELPVDELLERIPEVAQQSGKGPRAVLLEALQPLLDALVERAQPFLDEASRSALHARLRLLMGTAAW